MLSSDRAGQPQGATINFVMSCSVSLNALSTFRGLIGWEVQLEENSRNFKQDFVIRVVAMLLVAVLSVVAGVAVGCLYMVWYQ